MDSPPPAYRPHGRPWIRIWFATSAAIVGVSLYTGYRASIAANSPQYLLTRRQVVVEEPVIAENAVEAELESQLEEDGKARTTPVVRPMVVLGLADAACPAVVVSGAALWAWGRRRKPK